MTHPLAQARAEGYAANPGDENPYSGQGASARMWRLGYQAMLDDMVRHSQARQGFGDAPEWYTTA